MIGEEKISTFKKDRETLRKHFPKLKVGNSKITSHSDPHYNCIAWAAGENHRWWEYDPDGILGFKTYWPQEVPENESVRSWSRALEIDGGYKPSDNGQFESGFEKLAIYADKDGRPTHIARQVGPNRWTSKLGQGTDIEHQNLDLLAGDSHHEYGSVVRFLIRKKKRRARPKK